MFVCMKDCAKRVQLGNVEKFELVLLTEECVILFV